MGRGEKDYTQRIVGSLRDSGIHGGNVLFMDDCEALTAKFGGVGSGSIGLTTTTKTVWRGDQAGYVTPATGDHQNATWSFPIPTPSILSFEVLIRPSTTGTEFIMLDTYLALGTKQLQPAIRIYNDGSHVHFQYRNSSNAWVTLYTFNATVVYTAWHYLFMQVDLTNEEYRLVQFDWLRYQLSGTAVYSLTDTNGPYGTAVLDYDLIAGTSGSLYFDDLTILYEEL